SPSFSLDWAKRAAQSCTRVVDKIDIALSGQAFRVQFAARAARQSGRIGDRSDRIADEAPPEREELQVEAFGDQAPQPLRRDQHDEGGKRAEDDQVPGAEGREVILEEIEDYRPNDRTLDRADAA